MRLRQYEEVLQSHHGVKPRRAGSSKGDVFELDLQYKAYEQEKYKEKWPIKRQHVRSE